jgi:ER membrane protein complex subunit 3
MTTLLLDPDIRDWVVLPLFVMIVLAGLLRQIVARYMQGAKQPIPVVAVRANGVAKQCRALRTAAAHSISTASWMAHKDAAIELLREEAEWLESDENSGNTEDPMEKMMANPVGMLGGNMVFMVQNMVS